MNMIDKLKTMITTNKKKIIAVFIIWIILSVIIVGPLTISIVDATKADGSFSLKTCITELPNLIKQPFSALGVSFSNDSNIGVFFDTLGKFTLIYLVGMIALLMKMKSKGEYHDIEHGSSDWCENGEQYQILSPKKGVILAEKNYLPLDKRGNTNILVIRRFWSW